MNKRQFNFLIYLLIGALVSLYVSRPGELDRRGVHEESVPVYKIKDNHTLLLQKRVSFCSFLNERGLPVDEPELTELEQEYAFTQSFVFAPKIPVIEYLETDDVPFRAEHVPAHVPEINAPPPQLIATPA